MWVGDFDDNGIEEQIVTYHLRGQEICFASKTQLEKRMPVLKKKFLYAEDFAKTEVKDIFPAAKWQKAQRLYANHFENTVFVNNGQMDFQPKMISGAPQFTSLRSAVSIPGATGVQLLQLGNFYDYNVEIGRMDAGEGMLVNYSPKADPAVELFQGCRITGQVRSVQPIVIGGKQAYVLAKNNQHWQIIRKK
jgi:hypothetical protein